MVATAIDIRRQWIACILHKWWCLITRTKIRVTKHMIAVWLNIFAGVAISCHDHELRYHNRPMNRYTDDMQKGICVANAEGTRSSSSHIYTIARIDRQWIWLSVAADCASLHQRCWRTMCDWVCLLWHLMCAHTLSVRWWAHIAHINICILHSNMFQYEAPIIIIDISRVSMSFLELWWTI